MKRLHQASPCQHFEIAYSSVGEVMICPDCNVVHVSLQNMSLRFELEAFRSLAQMLDQAQGKIDHLRSMQIHRDHSDLPGADSHMPDIKVH